MCERCEEIRKTLEKSDERERDERVIITAAVGAILANHGPIVAVDIMADALGFLDYQIGIANPHDETKNGRDEMRRLFYSLVEGYHQQASDLLKKDREAGHDKEFADLGAMETSGTMH